MFNKILPICGVSVLLGLSGCGSMVEGMNRWAGLGVIKEDYSTFNESAIISVTPDWLFNGKKGYQTIKLGAKWESSSPESAVLRFKRAGGISSIKYVNFEQIEIKIDGEHHKFDMANITHHSSDYVQGSMYTFSENSAVIPLDLLVRMVSSEDCKIRINTIKFYEETNFSQDKAYGAGGAKSSIQRFLTKVFDKRLALGIDKPKDSAIGQIVE